VKQAVPVRLEWEQESDRCEMGGIAHDGTIDARVPSHTAWKKGDGAPTMGR